MLLIDVPRGDLSVGAEKSSLLHCCHKTICEHFDIAHLFGPSYEIHKRQPYWIFRDRPILGESSWGDRS